MSAYIRTTIKEFSELPKEARVKILQDIEQSDAFNTEWIQDPTDKTNYLPLSSFEVTGSKLWTGIFGQSYFSAYFIKIGGNMTATIGYRHW